MPPPIAYTGLGFRVWHPVVRGPEGLDQPDPLRCFLAESAWRATMHEQPKVVVVGHARSGTSLLYGRLRASLPEALGFFEPSDPAFLEQARETPQAVVAKLLLPVNGDMTAQLGAVFSRRLFLVRDPRDVLVSALLYVGGFEVMWRWEESRIARALALLGRKEAEPAAVGLLELFDAMRDGFSLEHISASLQLIEDFLAAQGESHPFFVVRYEDLLAGNTQALERVLGFALAPGVALESGLERVARTAGVASWRRWCTPADVTILQPLLEAPLQRFGYDAGDWLLAPHEPIPTHHASAYVRRLIDERRAQEQWRGA